MPKLVLYYIKKGLIPMTESQRQVAYAQALPALAQHLHEGRSFKSFRLDTEAWV